MLAYIGDARRIRFHRFQSYNGSPFGHRFGYNKRICYVPAFENLLLLYVLSEVHNRIDFRYKCAFVGCRRWENRVIRSRPSPQ